MLISCAHKAAPPAPDFYPPELDRIMARDQHHLILRFSEPVDSTILDSLSIEGLGIITGHIIGPELYLLTEAMAKRVYHFTVVARDRALNRRFIKGKFRGSDRSDTIPPDIIETTPLPFATDVPRLIRGKVRFTEELDTTLTPQVYLRPGTTRVERTWNKDMVRLELNYPDTLQSAAIYHLLILGRISDISKNEVTIARAFPFTTDSILQLIEIKSRVNPPCTALILARKNDIVGISINLPISGFTIYLKDTSDITLQALRLRPPMIGVGTITDSAINLKETESIDLDHYLR